MNESRTEALNQAVRVSLAQGGTDEDAQIVARATAFLTFLESR